MSKKLCFIATILTAFLIINTNCYAIESVDSILVNKQLLETNIEGKYDLRASVKNLRIKNQGTTGECWTFASLGALETNLLLVNKEVHDFSERHMNYATCNEFLQTDSNPNGTNPLGYNRKIKTGGNPIIAMSYMTRGSGPINEEDMPFSLDESKIDISEIYGKKVQKKIEDYIIFSSIAKERNNDEIIYKNVAVNENYSYNEVLEIRNNMKKHIIQYGGITALTMSGSKYDEYFNYEATKDGEIYPAYYCDNNELMNNPNHQVTLIGWDDNYSKENFNTNHKPIHDGAYLAMNSYGDENSNPNTRFKTGLFYISYDDIHVEQGAVGVIKASDVDYTNIYQHDPFGVSSSIIFSANNIFGANVFERDKKINEKIIEISVSGQVNVKGDIYINATNEELDPVKWTLVKQNVDIKAGYTTIKLEEPVKLTGDKFAVIIIYKSQNNENRIYIGIEKPTETEQNDFWSFATSEFGQSYIGSINEENILVWTDLKNTNIKNGNLCIKAFTEEESKYIISENKIYNVEPETTVEILKNNVPKSIKSFQLMDKDSNIIENVEKIKTGMKLKFDDKIYNIIVKGDLNGDGKVNTTDVVAMRNHMVSLDTVPYPDAGDIDLDGFYKANDLARIIDYAAELTTTI